jgi:hypothetical protein
MSTLLLSMPITQHRLEQWASLGGPSGNIEGPDVMLWQPGRGGLRFGGLTGLFYGVQMASSIARNRRDMHDTIFAALVAGAVMGTSGAPPCPALSGCSAAVYLAHRPSDHIMQEHFDTGYVPHVSSCACRSAAPVGSL